MKETWYFINSGSCRPSFNMAMDEVLLDWHSRGHLPPVLRFYRWEPAALSLGRFQKTEGRIDFQAAANMGIEVVRRPTGGLAVLHDRELTYSIIISEKHEKISPSVTETYRTLSAGLLEGYRNLGVSASLAVPEGAAGQDGTAVCFEKSSWYELEIEGRKAAGSAQNRQKSVVLQHGSIPIELNADTLYDLFIYPDERAKQRARQAFSEKAVSLAEVLGRTVGAEETEAAFRDGFEKGLDIDLVSYHPDQELIREAEKLMEEKYLNEAYTYQR